MNASYAQDLDIIARIEAIPNILDVVCNATGMGYAAVARVTADRWIAMSVLDRINFGLAAGGELQVETTLCNDVRENRGLVVINHVSKDEVYCGHPTPAMYGFESYISVPVRLADGSFFGTLCAIDPKPAQLANPQIVGMFTLFAELIGFHIDAQRKLMSAEEALLEERQAAQMREQFIAVLGHDIRSPMASISAGIQMLKRMALEPKADMILQRMEASVDRSITLIGNVMDFARARLAGGIGLQRSRDGETLLPYLQQVVAEVKSVHPERDIRSELDVPEGLVCDRSRVSQLLSNLLGNAVSHGNPDGPILVVASRDGTWFELAVTNHGDPIPADVRARLFQPFARRAGDVSQGLGLGLFIASEIAKAHQGTLQTESGDDRTTFTLRMPIGGR
ncbi:hypothetical protein DFR52_102561 [Hoeflea marina]|uniref:histidine kinase n=1 Tax=Hoeflea marina TaxID=274592 RepID=A0A317PMB1_9HYPH|nr:GAF domain-containing sensor histidine kinase [Hoeflea marina]PWW01897.1 hypothetical protein DFR52_102561 [Hoeflea marina]